MAKTDGKKAKKAKRPDSKPKGEKKGSKTETSNGLDGFAKIVDHPLITDLLAVGAMAAVAAIAEHGVASKSGDKSVEGSGKAVKAAGKAAAAAIGQRLMKEVGGFAGKAKS